MSRDVACRVSMFATTYKTFNINSLSRQIVETQNFALLSQKKFNIEKPAKIRLRKWHFAKFKMDMFAVLLSWLINFAILSGILIFTPKVPLYARFKMHRGLF